MPKADAAALTIIAPSIGRSPIHISSPSIALVGQAESSSGSGNTTGLSSSHAPTRAAVPRASGPERDEDEGDQSLQELERIASGCAERLSRPWTEVPDQEWSLARCPPS